VLLYNIRQMTMNLDKLSSASSRPQRHCLRDRINHKHQLCTRALGWHQPCRKPLNIFSAGASGITHLCSGITHSHQVNLLCLQLKATIDWGPITAAETIGAINSDSSEFLDDLGRRTTQVTKDNSETGFLISRSKWWSLWRWIMETGCSVTCKDWNWNYLTTKTETITEIILQLK